MTLATPLPIHPATLGALPRRWHAAPRRWGHSMHSICSYMAMFPPSMPHVFIDWLTQRGDVVYDPFSGRGTAPLEACLMGRRGLGSDANPLAWVLTSAKVDPPSHSAAMQRLDDLATRARDGSTSGIPDHIKMLFSQRTLARLAWLRHQLDIDDRVDRFLMAVLLGKLHANADGQGIPRGLTIAMPNTFAMAPAYVARYKKEHRLRAPASDPLAFLRRHVERVDWPTAGFARGRGWLQDARTTPKWPRNTPSAKLVFTSPPYLSVMKYGKFNWIRLWMLGCEPKHVDAELFATASLHKYVEFLSRMVARVRPVLRDDGYLCLVIGDVRQEIRSLNLASEVANALDDQDLTLIGTVVDRLPVDRKVSRIWGPSRGRATNTDRILLFAGPRAARPGAVPRAMWKE